MRRLRGNPTCPFPLLIYPLRQLSPSGSQVFRYCQALRLVHHHPLNLHPQQLQMQDPIHLYVLRSEPHYLTHFLPVSGYQERNQYNRHQQQPCIVRPEKI